MIRTVLAGLVSETSIDRGVRAAAGVKKRHPNCWFSIRSPFLGPGMKKAVGYPMPARRSASSAPIRSRRGIRNNATRRNIQWRPWVREEGNTSTSAPGECVFPLPSGKSDIVGDGLRALGCFKGQDLVNTGAHSNQNTNPNTKKRGPFTRPAFSENSVIGINPAAAPVPAAAVPHRFAAAVGA